jgi:hypothetical protein
MHKRNLIMHFTEVKNQLKKCSFLGFLQWYSWRLFSSGIWHKYNEKSDLDVLKRHSTLSSRVKIQKELDVLIRATRWICQSLEMRMLHCYIPWYLQIRKLGCFWNITILLPIHTLSFWNIRILLPIHTVSFWNIRILLQYHFSKQWNAQSKLSGKE